MDSAITTPELFRLLSLSIGREKPATPYMVAKVFGVTPTTTGYWMRGYTTMDDANAVKAAEMLGLDLDFVVLSLQAERANKSNMDKIAAVFERAAIASTKHAAALVFSVFLLFSFATPAPAQAAGFDNFKAAGIYIIRIIMMIISWLVPGPRWPRPAAF